MTAARKVVLIVATVLVVGGAALSFGAFAAAGFDFTNLSNARRDWVPQSVVLPTEAEGAHASITVREGTEGVRFEPSDGDAIEVAYWTNDDRQVSVTDEDGAVSIEETNRNGFHIMLLYIGDFQDRSTVVKVPRGFTGTVTAEADNANIDVSRIEGLDGMTLTSQNGHITVAQAEAGSVRITAQNGMIEAADVTARQLSADTQNGTATLAGIVADDLEARSTNGSVHLSRVSAQRVKADSMNGFIHAASVAADGTELGTTNGGIEASLVGAPGAYSVSATSTHGRVDVPEGIGGADAPKRLIARSENGSISVTFTDGGAGSGGVRDDGCAGGPRGPRGAGRTGIPGRTHSSRGANRLVANPVGQAHACPTVSFKGATKRSMRFKCAIPFSAHCGVVSQSKPPARRSLRPVREGAGARPSLPRKSFARTPGT